MLTVYGYHKCATCRKAMKWLDDQGLEYNFIDITQQPPDMGFLEKVLGEEALEMKHLYNTSGRAYRQRNMGEQRNTMSEAEQLEALASDGMLIRRPIVTDGKRYTVGFKPEVFEDVWG